MLGFDIETTGFIQQIPEAEISVVCTMDSETMEQTVYNFMIENEEGKTLLRNRLIEAFHNATRLCAYNAVLFDIPFMQKQLNIPHKTVHEWLGKLCDPFHCIKTCFDFTCKLDKMLTLNGLECKSSTGLEAVNMAKTGDWKRLVDYCMDDVRLTVQLCQLEKVALFFHPDGFWVYCTYIPRLKIWTSKDPPTAMIDEPSKTLLPSPVLETASGLGVHEGKSRIEELAEFVNICNGV